MGLCVSSMGRALSRILFRLLFWEFFARRDIIPVRVGLRLAGAAVEASLLVNRTLLHDPLFGEVLPARLGLEDGDFGGFRLRIWSVVVR